MSVLVIGMDYPDNCLQCSFVRIVSGHYYCGCNANCMLGEYVGEHLEGVGRHEGCPLVELPEKHGRLIDADAMKRVWMGARIDGDIGMLLDARPTIVEAEGE